MSDKSGLLSQFYFKIDGANPPAQLVSDLVDITVENSLHLPDVATLRFHDARLRWIDDDKTLALGKPLVISAKAGGGERPLFDGEIVEIEPDFGVDVPHVIVRAFDRLHRLMRGRHVRTFTNMTDEEIIKKLAQEAGLKAEVGPTKQTYDYLFQANQTNLGFLQERAAALGYLLYVEGKTLHCEPPRPSGKQTEIAWGQSLSEFRPRMTTIGQYSSIVVRGWDPFTRKEIEREVKRGDGAPKIKEQRSGGEVAQNAFQISAQQLIADRPIRTHAEAEQLAKAMADRSAQRFVEAEGVCGGNPAIIAGSALQISAVGERFGGTYYVTGATHIYNADQGYSTQFVVSGLHPTTLLSMMIGEPAEQIPSGLVIGIVTDNQDPKGLGRVKVSYPWLAREHTSDWARIVVVGGGGKRGIQFLPEVNDEVLVGFELGDLHQPFVLGGLWNGIDEPPESSKTVVEGGKVKQRIIRSRAGHTIVLDDTDGAGGITIVDRGGNAIKLESESNKLTIAIKGDAALKAEGNLTIEAQGEVKIKGSSVTVDGMPGKVDVKGKPINLN